MRSARRRTLRRPENRSGVRGHCKARDRAVQPLPVLADRKPGWNVQSALEFRLRARLRAADAVLGSRSLDCIRPVGRNARNARHRQLSAQGTEDRDSDDDRTRHQVPASRAHRARRRVAIPASSLRRNLYVDTVAAWCLGLELVLVRDRRPRSGSGCRS